MEHKLSSTVSRDGKVYSRNSRTGAEEKVIGYYYHPEEEANMKSGRAQLHIKGPGGSTTSELEAAFFQGILMQLLPAVLKEPAENVQVTVDFNSMGYVVEWKVSQ